MRGDICQSRIYFICSPHKVRLFYFLFCQSHPQESVSLFPAAADVFLFSSFASNKTMLVWQSLILWMKVLLIPCQSQIIPLFYFSPPPTSICPSKQVPHLPLSFIFCHHLSGEHLGRIVPSIHPLSSSTALLLLTQKTSLRFFMCNILTFSTFKPVKCLPLFSFIPSSSSLSTPFFCILCGYIFFLLFQCFKSLLDCTFFLFLPRMSSHFVFIFLFFLLSSLSLTLCSLSLLSC